MTCCFVGHKDVAQDVTENLTAVLTELIAEGIDSFLVGNQGGFDRIVPHTLRRLKKKYPHIVDYEHCFVDASRNKKRVL